MQAASVLKPSALSLQLLPSADVYCTRHCSHLLSLTCVYTSMQAKCYKNLSVWRGWDTSIHDFLNFWFFSLGFWCYWRASYTSALWSLKNVKRLPLIFDVLRTRQRLRFYDGLFCLTCKHTSMIRFFSSLTYFYTSLKLVSSTDVYSTRQCMPNAKKWCLTCDLHVSGTFSFPLTCGPHVTEANVFYWHVNHTSLHADFSKSLFFRTTDIKILCRRHHRVTVLAPVRLNSQKTKKFCLEAEAKRFLNCKQYFS